MQLSELYSFPTCESLVHLSDILLENRVDYLNSKYVPLLQQAIEHGKIMLGPDQVNQLPELKRKRWMSGIYDDDAIAMLAPVVLQQIMQADPDIHKKNTQWLLNVILSGRSILEDLYKATNDLNIYARVKHLLPQDKRDLNRYKTFNELYAVVKPLEQEMSKREIDRTKDADMHQQAEIVYNSANYKIVIPQTREAACHFGTNTRWCTAATGSSNYFQHYHSEGPLYVILDKANNQRWQFHPHSGQFADETDRQINVAQWITTHSEAAKALEQAIYPETPIAKLGDLHGDLHPVFKDRNGNFVVRDANKSPLLGKPFLTLKVQDGQFIGASGMLDYNPSAMAALLNQLALKGVPDGTTNPSLFNLYYRSIGGDLGFEDMRWQTAQEAAKPFLRSKKGWYWGAISTSDSQLMILVQNDKVLCQAETFSDGNFMVTDAAKRPASWEKRERDQWRQRMQPVGEAIVDLLLRLKNVKTWESTAGYSAGDLMPEDAKRLIDAKPGLGDLLTVYHALGSSPIVRRMVMKALAHGDEDGNEIPHTKNWINKDQLIVYQWDNVEAALDDILTDKGRDFYKNYIGEDSNYEVYDVDISAFIGDLLAHLAKTEPKQFAALGGYLAKEWPELVEQMEEDSEFQNDQYNPQSLNDVEELFGRMLQNGEGGDVETAMERAVMRGEETGAMDEAYTIFKQEINSSPFLYFASGKKGGKTQWTGQLKDWEAPVAFAVSLDDVVRWLDEDANGLADSGWFDYLDDSRLTPETPYNGLSDFNEESAYETFSDELREIDIDDTDDTRPPPSDE